MYRYEKEDYPEVESICTCINNRKCKSYVTDLADGWCVNCWDKGETSRRRIKATIKMREKLRLDYIERSI